MVQVHETDRMLFASESSCWNLADWVDGIRNTLQLSSQMVVSGPHSGRRNPAAYSVLSVCSCSRCVDHVDQHVDTPPQQKDGVVKKRVAIWKPHSTHFRKCTGTWPQRDTASEAQLRVRLPPRCRYASQTARWCRVHPHRTRRTARKWEQVARAPATRWGVRLCGVHLHVVGSVSRSGEWLSHSVAMPTACCYQLCLNSQQVVL